MPFREALELMRASKGPMGTGVDISERPVAALIKATFLEIARPPLVLHCNRRLAELFFISAAANRETISAKFLVKGKRRKIVVNQARRV